MNKKFLISGLITTAINLILNAVSYIFILKDFYQSHPVVSEVFQKQLHRQPDQLIVWAMVVTSLSMGFLITTVIKWSGANSFASGLKSGFILAFLFWGSVNFGLYASSNFFSQATLFVDYVCSVTAMTIAAAVAAWLLGRGKSN
ncbi:hypothetical protein JNM05_04670 [bacterium]|nr:hypothetical protein [bacterium]